MPRKHSPGPWVKMTEEVDKPYIRIRGSVLGSRFKIANVLTPVYDGIHAREAEETRANADLIMAAPDLLDALIQCVAVMDRDLNGLAVIQPELMKAKGAIAKAKGEV